MAHAWQESRPEEKPSLERDFFERLVRFSPLAIEFGSPISSSEVDWYGELLQLSEAQSVRLKMLFEEYEGRGREAIQKHSQAILDSARGCTDRLNAANNYAYDLAAVNAYAAFAKSQRDLMQDFNRAARELFSGVLAILTEEQAAALPRVEMLRKRFEAANMSHLVPGARVDLTFLIREVYKGEDTPEAIDPLLEEYEQQLTPLVERLRKLSNDNAEKVVEIAHRLQYRADGTKVERGAPDARAHTLRYMDETIALNSTTARVDARIAALNRVYIKQLIELLPTKDAAKLRALYQDRGYPMVFADPLDIEALYQRIGKRVGAAGELHDAIVALWEPYRVVYDSLSEKMMEESDDRGYQQERTTSSIGFEKYRVHIRRLRDERWARSAALIEQIKNMLPPEILADVGPDILDFEKRFAELTESAKSDTYPAPLMQ